MPSVISPYSFSDLDSPKDLPTNKKAILQALYDNGHVGALSWEDASVPSALVEVEAEALTDQQLGTQQILRSGFNSKASGDALATLSLELYNNARRTGTRVIGRILLTDTGSGPWTFDPTSKSFSVGQGGLAFDGIADPTGAIVGNITLPLNGSAYVWVQASDVGGKYNVNTGAINTMARGVLPGVIVNNPSDWLQQLGSVAGADAELDVSLQARNQNQWGTLGTGSPQSAYINWIRAVDVSITKVKIFTNLNLLDPGSITAIIAGAAGALSGTIVAAVQNAIAPNQIGGSKIPESARFIASTATNNSVPINATLYIAAAYNTPAFQAQILANLLAFQSALDIGALISWERVQEVVLSIAGDDPTIIPNADWNAPLADIQQLYYQNAIFDVTNLKFVSVGG